MLIKKFENHSKKIKFSQEKVNFDQNIFFLSNTFFFCGCHSFNIFFLQTILK